MKIVQLGKAALAGLLALASGPGAYAQTAVDLAALATGPQVTVREETYAVLTGVRAVAARQAEAPAQALARVGLAGSQSVGRKGGFVLYRDAGPAAQRATPALAALPAAGASHPVLLNKRTGQVAVVLGSVGVKLKSMADADAVAAAHGLTLTHRFDHLSTAFYSAAAGQDLLAALAALRADPRVAQADLDLLEHMLVPH
jgi:hypothetical protein